MAEDARAYAASGERDADELARLDKAERDGDDSSLGIFRSGKIEVYSVKKQKHSTRFIEVRTL